MGALSTNRRRRDGGDQHQNAEIDSRKESAFNRVQIVHAHRGIDLGSIRRRATDVPQVTQDFQAIHKRRLCLILATGLLFGMRQRSSTRAIAWIEDFSRIKFRARWVAVCNACGPFYCDLPFRTLSNVNTCLPYWEKLVALEGAGRTAINVEARMRQ